LKHVFLGLSLLIAGGCFYGPAISNTYDFSQVGKIELLPIEDHSYLSGSGDLVSASITHNFLKYGFKVNEGDFRNTTIFVNSSPQSLELKCIITDYTDSESIVVPYHYEDRGYVSTTVNQSTESNENAKNSNANSSTKTTTDAGTVQSGSRIEYTRARVGVNLKLIDMDTGALVWSNSYWYSSFDIHRATEICVRHSINQLKKLFK